jgi:hypothetical protein
MDINSVGVVPAEIGSGSAGGTKGIGSAIETDDAVAIGPRIAAAGVG